MGLGLGQQRQPSLFCSERSLWNKPEVLLYVNVSTFLPHVSLQSIVKCLVNMKALFGEVS